MTADPSYISFVIEKNGQRVKHFHWTDSKRHAERVAAREHPNAETIHTRDARRDGDGAYYDPMVPIIERKWRGEAVEHPVLMVL